MKASATRDEDVDNDANCDVVIHVGSLSNSVTTDDHITDTDDDAAADELADKVPELLANIDVDDQPTVVRPPDGGWGWMVVAAAFLVNLIVDGVAYTFGIIMPELLHHFEAGKGKTALVGSLIPGVYLIVGKKFICLC